MAATRAAITGRGDGCWCHGRLSFYFDTFDPLMQPPAGLHLRTQMRGFQRDRLIAALQALSCPQAPSCQQLLAVEQKLIHIIKTLQLISRHGLRLTALVAHLQLKTFQALFQLHQTLRQGVELYATSSAGAMMRKKRTTHPKGRVLAGNPTHAFLTLKETLTNDVCIQTEGTDASRCAS